MEETKTGEDLSSVSFNDLLPKAIDTSGIQESIKDDKEITQKNPVANVEPFNKDGQTLYKSDEKSEDKEVLKAKHSAHLTALSHIETLFSDKYTDEERLEFFNEHKELADIANKSKKFKDTYRGLYKQKKEEKVNDNEEEEEEKEIKKLRDVELSNILLEKLTNKVLAEQSEKQLINERKTECYNFAVRNGLNEREFNRIYNLSSALYKADDNITYEDALVSSMKAIGKNVSSESFNLPQSSFYTKSSKESVIDKDTEITRLQRTHFISKENAERVFDNLKKNKADYSLDSKIKIDMGF